MKRVKSMSKCNGISSIIEFFRLYLMAEEKLKHKTCGFYCIYKNNYKWREGKVIMGKLLKNVHGTKSEKRKKMNP